MVIEDEITLKLENLYSKIDSEGKKAILNGQEVIDPILSSIELDKRLGLTLLIAIKGKITENFRILIDKIQQIEPAQYFYPVSDFHVTILDFIKANEDFEREENTIKKCIKIVENAAHDLPPFNIEFKGIISSNAAILVKGYYGFELQLLRSQIRKNALENDFNLKERYQTVSAHSTIIRFRKKLRNIEKLSEIVQEYNNFNIGVMNVNKLELVVHDWYNCKKEIIEEFFLT